MSVIDSALVGLIDYAGLYSPAAVDALTTIHSHLTWRQLRTRFRARTLDGDIGRLTEFGAIAGSSLPD